MSMDETPEARKTPDLTDPSLTDAEFDEAFDRAFDQVRTYRTDPPEPDPVDDDAETYDAETYADDDGMYDSTVIDDTDYDAEMPWRAVTSAADQSEPAVGDQRPSPSERLTVLAMVCLTLVALVAVARSAGGARR